MKTWTKVVIGVALSFMCIFVSLGYAQLSTELTIKGSANIAPPNSIFIYEITDVVTSGATLTTSPVSIDFPSTKVLSEITFSGKGSYVTFNVHMLNGTLVDHIFDILEEMSTMTDGSELSYAGVDWTVSPGQGTVVKAGQMTTFSVTLKYTGSGTNQTRKMLHNFNFELNSDDLTQIVSKGVTDRFADILNNMLEEDVYYEYDGKTNRVSKDSTFSAIDANMEGSKPSWFSSGRYIGNLTGADADDLALMDALFGDTLTFPIDGKEEPITVMVKEKNVVGSSDLDMVLYITGDKLSATYTYVPVYAVVFSKNADGVWEQQGDIFAGEARTNNYSGTYGSGSFDTETWRSKQVYYGKAVRSSIAAVMDGYES